jgi:hypothetical protein
VDYNFVQNTNIILPTRKLRLHKSFRLIPLQTVIISEAQITSSYKEFLDGVTFCLKTKPKFILFIFKIRFSAGFQRQHPSNQVQLSIYWRFCHFRTNIQLIGSQKFIFLWMNFQKNFNMKRFPIWIGELPQLFNVLMNIHSQLQNKEMLRIFLKEGLDDHC